MNTLRCAAFAAVSASAALSARADIVQPTNSGYTSFFVLSAFGQSFTATAAEPQVSTVSFAWASVSTSFSPPSVTVNLREGVGFGGAILGTQTISSISNSTPDNAWVDFTFATPIALTAGSMYSLQFINNSGIFPTEPCPNS